MAVPDPRPEAAEVPASPQGRMASALIWIASLAIIAMMVNICADVIGRSVFNRPVAGTLELVTYLYMVSVVFLPLAMIQLERQHVVVEVFAQLLPARAALWVDRFALLATAGYTGFVGWWSMQEAIRATTKGEMIVILSSDVPLWPTRWLLPIGLFAMLVVVIAQLVASFRTAPQKLTD